VGEAVGDAVGDDVGEAVGDAVGESVGDAVGESVGDAVGESVGDAVGEAVGSIVGFEVGAKVVGARVVGGRVGASVQMLHVFEHVPDTPSRAQRVSTCLLAHVQLFHSIFPSMSTLNLALESWHPQSTPQSLGQCLLTSSLKHLFTLLFTFSHVLLKDPLSIKNSNFKVLSWQT